ncbi:lysine biosynthesis protein LysX [Actinomadura sp. HBU206391]|uniref:lysine biosynthesis protein LysX n=1 Tax=Actinomadura sp. HBU206391 TaxID=2731692 RepID=UPI001C9BCB64|nr:lysine biosynthesis protein LysX [Actinomadura sp. HBU206391]
MKALAVVASRVRFEEKQIFAALERRRIPYVHIDARRFSAELPTATEPALPAGDRRKGEPRAERDRPYAAALNREISQSRGYYASLLLEAQGVPAVNRAEVIATCGDKLRTSLELTRAGLPIPRTAVALTRKSAAEVMDKLGFPVVVKPLTGSWGRLAAVLRDHETAEAVLEHRAALPSPQQHVVYLQELIDKPGRDIRVIVVGDDVVAATYRSADGWRTNVARGGRSWPCPLSDELTRLALAAARAVGGGVLGVDLVENRDGRLHVLEVNHTVEFKGVQTAHGDTVDVADAIVGQALAEATE